MRPFFIAVGVLTLAFALPLSRLTSFALQSDLYSHVILVPIVTAGLIWMRRGASPAIAPRLATGAIVCALLAATALGYALLAHPSPTLEAHHALTWSVAAYALAVGAAALACLGTAFVRAHMTAFSFLVFMIPMPGWLERGMEVALQRGSAEAAHAIFALSNIPFLRDGQVFRLPSITMEIAQECSGIHSSLVLFLVSIVAGQMFLPSGWRRWALTLFVIPLALIRNGFRVFTLGYLCETVGPHMIHHWIHHRGGPVFFALSLIPFFLTMAILVRVGRNARRETPALPHQATQH